MRAPSVEELYVPANACPSFWNVRVGMEIDLLIFDRPPEALHDDVVSPGAFAVHADLHACVSEDLRELQAGELAALIGIEDLRPPETGKGFFNRLDAERRFQRDRHPPRQDSACEPVDDRSQINEPPGHGEWSRKRFSASPPRTVRAPFSAYGSLFNRGPRPWRRHDIGR